jgi:hypothetical protein
MSTCMNINISFSQYRHVANAFANTLDVTSVTEAIKMLIAEQTGHNQQTSDSIYGLSAEKLRKLDSTSLNLFYQISILWHDWLGMSSKKDVATVSEPSLNQTVSEYNRTTQSNNINIESKICALESEINALRKKIGVHLEPESNNCRS